MSVREAAVEELTRIAAIFIDGAFAMLLLGMAHSTDARIPAFGYLACLCLVAALTIVVQSGAHAAVKVGKR